MVNLFRNYIGGNIMASDKRVTFILKCTECGEENYLTEKNKKTTTDRIELKKFCPKCRKQTLHKEKTKK